VAIEPAPAAQLRHSLPTPPSAEGAALNGAGHGAERPSLFKRPSRGIAFPAPSDDVAEVGAWPAAAIAESVRKEKPLAPLEGWQASLSDAASIPGTHPPAHAPPKEVDDAASHLGPLEAWQLPPPEVPKPSSLPLPRANAAVEEAARVLTGDEPPAPKPSWRERARSASQSIKGVAARAATAAKAATEARRGEYSAVRNAADEEPSARGQGAWRETRETHWDVMHRLQRAEASVRADASLEEVQAMVHTFTEAAEQLEVMGEPDKARDVMEIFLPSFFERADVQLVLQSVGSSTPAPSVPSIAPPSTPPPPPRGERSLAQEYFPMGDAAAAGSAHCSPGSSFDVHVSCTADAHPYTWSGNLKQLHPVDAAAVVFQDAIRNASRRSTGRTTELSERLVHKPEDEEHVTCCCFGGKPAARTRRAARDNSCTHLLATGWSVSTSRQQTCAE